MIVIQFFIVFIAVMGGSGASLMPQAILQLVQSYYVERSVVIEVLYSSREVKILGETLKLLSGGNQLKVTPMNIVSPILIGPDEYEKCFLDPQIICRQNYSNDAIFLLDTLDNYQIWKNRFAYSQSFVGRTKLNHLVYCEDANQESVESLITRDTYESFLFEQNNQVSLNTITMYTEKQCRSRQLVEINQFSIMERKWKTGKFFKPRIDNFHGCKLWIDFQWTDAQMPFLRFHQVESTAWFPEGAIVDMLDALSTNLNFTYLYGLASEKNAEELGFEWVDTYDLMIGVSVLDSLSNPSSYPIYSTADVAIVPPGELFTSWEKLLMPFDWQTWMWLGIVFTVAFFVIFMIRLSKSSSIHEIIIGSNVTSPSLNVIAIFMGIGQILLPQRNVSRFMFMVFILFSLIMRTAYQGKYFEFLTSDMRRNPIQTIEELKEKNFTAIVHFNHWFNFLCKTDLLAR